MHKLLIVDESSATRGALARALRRSALPATTLLEASSGAEALAKLSSDPDIELILSDVEMPEVNGLELVTAVRALHGKQSLPMIMVAAEGGDALLKRALDLGANGYVTKPCTPDAIRRALEAYLG